MKTYFTHLPHILTTVQVTRLLYSKGSAKYVSAKLKILTQQKFLHRLERETINLPYVYCLGVRGIWHLHSLGRYIPLFHPSEHTTHRPMFLRHTLAVNDFLIAAATLPTIAPDISVHEIKHDLTLKLTRTRVIPDGWIDFRLQQKTQLCIWLEMDMGQWIRSHSGRKSPLSLIFPGSPMDTFWNTITEHRFCHTSG